jgi:hypothetical protein
MEVVHSALATQLVNTCTCQKPSRGVNSSLGSQAIICIYGTHYTKFSVFVPIKLITLKVSNFVGFTVAEYQLQWTSHVL